MARTRRVSTRSVAASATGAATRPRCGAARRRPRAGPRPRGRGAACSAMLPLGACSVQRDRDGLRRPSAPSAPAPPDRAGSLPAPRAAESTAIGAARGARTAHRWHSARRPPIPARRGRAPLPAASTGARPGPQPARRAHAPATRPLGGATARPRRGQLMRASTSRRGQHVALRARARRAPAGSARSARRAPHPNAMSSGPGTKPLQACAPSSWWSRSAAAKPSAPPATTGFLRQRHELRVWQQHHGSRGNDRLRAATARHRRGDPGDQPRSPGRASSTDSWLCCYRRSCRDSVSAIYACFLSQCIPL